MASEGYYGTHGAVELYCRNKDIQVLCIEDDNLKQLMPGDLLLVESPQNPRGEVSDFKLLKSKIKDKVIFAVDASFCPPPLQYNHDFGIVFIMRCRYRDAFFHKVSWRAL